MWDSHLAIKALKQRELTRVRRLLAEAYGEGLTPSVSAGLALEQRLGGVSEWPYDIRTLRSLIVSFLVPAITAGGRFFVGDGF
jgi:hypothetical protein